MDTNAIVSVSIYAFVALTVLGGFLVGMRKRFWRALVYLGVVVAAALLAFGMTNDILVGLGKPTSLEEWQAAVMAEPRLAEYADAFIELADALPGTLSLIMLIPFSLLGPLLFGLFFGVYRIVLGIAAGIICLVLRFVFPKNDHPSKINRLSGGVLGAVRGVILTFVVLFPIIGYSAMVDDVLAVTDQAVSGENYQAVKQEVTVVTDEILLHPVSRAVFEMGGESAFTYLTNAYYTTTEGETLSVDWNKEIKQYSNIILHALPLKDVKLEDFGEAQANAIKNIAGDVGSSQVLSHVIAEVLSAVCSKWDAGEPFLSIQKPTTEDENTAAILETAIDTFKNSTPATVAEDLMSVAELFSVMVKYDAFTSMSDPEQLMDLLNNNDFMADAIDVLKNNERLEGLLKETVKTGVKAALETAVDQDSFNQAIEAVNQAAADQLNALSHLDAEEQKAAVADAITDAMADHSIEGGSAVVDYVAELLVEEFADKIADGSVSPDEIADYLGLYPKS